MIGAGYIAAAYVLAARHEMELVQMAREAMTPEQFKEWQAERTAERRHRELCSSIEQAGTNARPRGLGVFW